jgi:hypothetical protein
VIRNCVATGGHLVDTDRDAYIVQGDTYRHVWCTDPTGRLHVLGDPPTPPFADLRTRPLAVGDVLYGYCRGVFGASYGAKTVEAIGSDWLTACPVGDTPE